MSGIMMLADPNWFAYHERNSVGKLAIFYASPHKRTDRKHRDPLFCVRPGKRPRSIVGVGRIQEQLILDQDAAWSKYGKTLGADTESEWRAQASAVLENSRKTYGGQMLAIELDDFRAFTFPLSLEAVGIEDKGWSDKKTTNDEATTVLLRSLNLEPSEVSPDEQFPEGAVRQIFVNRYERDSRARKICIARYGPTCVVCKFDFGAVYGPIADGFIHVHHIKPLSEIGREYFVDPVEDLRPVCPNCHAVLHFGGKVRSINEVIQLLRT
ncbi:MAG TPA: HNH endonuclease [Thermoanaerobaculia bacterium]|jgi:predicted HNH restriction endonuclease|nr:HNH endonuclease [Thermoanaerobaculia bacterium]